MERPKEKGRANLRVLENPVHMAGNQKKYKITQNGLQKTIGYGESPMEAGMRVIRPVAGPHHRHGQEVSGLAKTGKHGPARNEKRSARPQQNRRTHQGTGAGV